MRDMSRLHSNICEELDRIAEKGLSTSNLETAYKLIDMYKDLKNIEYWEMKSRYYEDGMDDMQDGSYRMEEDGYSSRRKRDSMGRYSRDGEKTDHGLDRGTSYRRGYSRDRDGYGDETYDRYMRHKQSYRDSKTPECKQRMMDALDEHMDKFTQQMEELMRDSDCAEERTAIRHYLDKLKNIA